MLQKNGEFVICEGIFLKQNFGEENSVWVPFCHQPENPAIGSGSYGCSGFNPDVAPHYHELPPGCQFSKEVSQWVGLSTFSHNGLPPIFDLFTPPLLFMIPLFWVLAPRGVMYGTVT